MEVKIKQGEEMIDATIEMVDGVMVVSTKEVKFEPKEVKFEPKDGDVVSTKRGNHVFIFRNGYKEESSSGYCHIGWNLQRDTMFRKGIWAFGRPATEEEKKKLFDRLAEEGLTWDAEKKELVKLKWKPKEGEIFHFPIFSDELGEFVIDYQENYGTIFMSIERDWYFKTEQECQEFCNRLNDAISQVKP